MYFFCTLIGENKLTYLTAVKGNLADNPMDIKVGLLETTQ